MMKSKYLIWSFTAVLLIALISAACSNSKNIKPNKMIKSTSVDTELAIDRYRIEAAFEVHKNWIEPKKSSSISPKHVAQITFRIMPDGTIIDIVLVNKSGSTHLDKAALEAIKRTSPLKPYPKELSKAYVEMGLRFGNEGVK